MSTALLRRVSRGRQCGNHLGARYCAGYKGGNTTSGGKFTVRFTSRPQVDQNDPDNDNGPLSLAVLPAPKTNNPRVGAAILNDQLDIGKPVYRQRCATQIAPLNRRPACLLSEGVTHVVLRETPRRKQLKLSAVSYGLTQSRLAPWVALDADGVAPEGDCYDAATGLNVFGGTGQYVSSCVSVM